MLEYIRLSNAYSKVQNSTEHCMALRNWKISIKALIIAIKRFNDYNETMTERRALEHCMLNNFGKQIPRTLLFLYLDVWSDFNLNKTLVFLKNRKTNVTTRTIFFSDNLIRITVLVTKTRR